MSEVIVRMEMPKVCITKGGYYGNCPMDRVWCIQRNAPSEMVMKDAYAEMTESIPSWCPIIGVLPEQHGDLIDADAIWERAWQNKGKADPFTLAEELCNSPVIIEATERSEHGTTTN